MCRKVRLFYVTYSCDIALLFQPSDPDLTDIMWNQSADANELFLGNWRNTCEWFLIKIN